MDMSKVTVISLIVVFAAWPMQAAEEARPQITKPHAKPVMSRTSTDNAAGEKDSHVQLKVTVVSVRGGAFKRDTSEPKAEWKPIKAGETLNVRTLIRTGFGARVVLRFSDRGNVTIRKNTKIGIGEFYKRGKVVKVRLGLKYGSMRAKVNGSAGSNDFQVATPVATLSSRGCELDISFSSDFGLIVKNMEHTWVVTTPGGDKTIEQGQSTDGKLTPSEELLALRLDTQLGDPFGGLSEEEKKNLRSRGSGRGIFTFNGGAGSYGGCNRSIPSSPVIPATPTPRNSQGTTFPGLSNRS